MLPNELPFSMTQVTELVRKLEEAQRRKESEALAAGKEVYEIDITLIRKSKDGVQVVSSNKIKDVELVGLKNWS